MKFQYTKHKELWNRIIRMMEFINVPNDEYKPFGLLHSDCLTDRYITYCSYACEYAKRVRTNEFAPICRYCPVKSCIVLNGRIGLYRNLVATYSSDDMINAIKYAKLIRDISVKEGVEFE